MEIQIGDSIMGYKLPNHPEKSFCTFKCSCLCHKKEHTHKNTIC